jgi:hypothetical protein
VWHGAWVNRSPNRGLVFWPLNFQTTLQTTLINRAKEETAMTTRYALFVAAAVVAVLGMQAGSAQALTMTECSAKYKEGKNRQ